MSLHQITRRRARGCWPIAVASWIAMAGACSNKPTRRAATGAEDAAGSKNSSATTTTRVDARVLADASVDSVTRASEAWDGGVSDVVPAIGRTLTMAAPLNGRSPRNAPVFVVRDAPAAAAIRRALDGLGVRVPVDRRVVIKINLGGYDRMKRRGTDDGVTGRITDKGFVRALVIELRRRGVTDIALADGASNTAKQFAKLLRFSGYRDLAASLAVPFIDLNHYGDGDARPRPWRMKLPWAKYISGELLLSNDLVRPGRRAYLIDVPKMKAHRFAVMSLSIKNLMGVVMIDDRGRSTPPWKRRWRMHRELAPWLRTWKKSRTDDRPRYRKALSVFSERLADLYGAITPDLVLLEGYPAMQGDGFARVVPFGPSILIASKNGCFADYVAADYFGLVDSERLKRELGVIMPPAILAVAKRFFGGLATLRAIDVRGDVDWRIQDGRRPAWFVGMAPFRLNALP